MNKTIFNLKHDDIIDLEKEMKNNSYYKQFNFGFGFSAICLFIAWVVFIGYSIFFNIPDFVELICIIILFLGFSIVYLMIWCKRLNLIKEYYDEKNKQQ